MSTTDPAGVSQPSNQEHLRTQQQPGAEPPRRARRELVVAWTSAAFTLLALPTLTVVGESWAPVVYVAMLVAGGVALWSGLRARRHGASAGIVPALLGGVVAGFFVLLLALSLLGHFVLGLE